AAGVRYRDVETPRGRRRLDGGADGRLVGHITDRDTDGGARRDLGLQRRGGLTELVLGSPRDRHRRAVTEQMTGAGQTAPPPPTRDERELPLERERRVCHATLLARSLRTLLRTQERITSSRRRRDGDASDPCASASSASSSACPADRSSSPGIPGKPR